jgi:predicted Zn-dependent peptidase
VHRAGSVQSNIVVGNTTWMATDARGYALSIANQVLGGASDSRLFTDPPRTEGLDLRRLFGVDRTASRLGSFSATAEVRTEVTDSALVELLAQVRRMGGAVHPRRRVRARRSRRSYGSLPTADRDGGRGGGAGGQRRDVLGLANDYVQTYRQRVIGR